MPEALEGLGWAFHGLDDLSQSFEAPSRTAAAARAIKNGLLRLSAVMAVSGHPSARRSWRKRGKRNRVAARIIEP
ncbi:MAG TPA: hypothetical protein VIL97_00040 [Thermoanaerobaculia bacterium]